MPTSRENVVLYDKVRKEKYPLDELYNLVELAGTAHAGDAPVFEKALSSQYPEMRYWASVGLAQLGAKGELKTCPASLLALLNDADPYIACEAAYAAAYLGETAKGIERLNNPAKEADRKIGYSLLECLSLDKAMQPAIRVHLADLKDKAETLPRKANEDAGLMARGILVNLGEMDIKNLHGPESYQLGLKLNHGRRPMVPLQLMSRTTGSSGALRLCLKLTELPRQHCRRYQAGQQVGNRHAVPNACRTEKARQNYQARQ